MVSNIASENNIYNSGRAYAKEDETTLYPFLPPRTIKNITTFEGQREGVHLDFLESSSGSSTTINNSGISNNTRVSNIVNSNLQINFVSKTTSKSFTVREENPLQAATEYINDVTEDDIQVVVKHFRVKNMEGLIFGHLNVNSIRNKFEAIKLLVEGNLDIINISEKNLDYSFPVEQFCIDGYNTPFRLDKK